MPSWQVLFWFGFSYSPCCVGSNLLSSVLLCSSPVYPFLLAFVWFIVLFRSALVQAVLLSLVCSVLAGLFWSISFGLSGLVFHIAPVVLDPISYHLFCSALVQSTLSCSHSFGSSFCLGLLWSKLFSSVWFGLFWLVCSGLLALVCTAPVFSRLCPPGRFCSGLVFHIAPVVLDPISYHLFCSAQVQSTLSCSLSSGLSFCLGLLWSKLFSSVWFALFWLVCSGLLALVCLVWFFI